MAAARILLADDDVDALRIVGVMLERQGYEIIAATNGHQAIEKAIEAQPALIILDVMMPQMDGFEVAAKLRDHPATESIPILIFTAKAAVNDKIAGFQAGADDYLTKPIHPGELISRVEVLLQRQGRMSERLERGNIIAFLPTKGGIGTSTLTLNTAIELQRMRGEARIAVVELQDGGGTMALQAGLDGPKDGNRGLPVFAGKPLSHLTRERLNEQLVRHSSGVRLLLTTSMPVGTGPTLGKVHMRTLLRYLSIEFDYLLLDLPARLDEAYRETLQQCSLIIMTVEPNRIGLDLTLHMLKSLDALNISGQKVRIVLIHRAPASGTLNREMIEQTLHREMIAGIPPAPDLAYESVKNGKPMVLIQPQGLVAQQVRRIVQTIADS
jgi:DNA-binding response OmpR family regulator